MAEYQLTLPGQIVKKHNNLIRTKVTPVSVDASRIFASLVACIRADDTTLKAPYVVAVKDFIPDSSGRGYARVKGLCKELGQILAEMEEPDPDGDHPIFTACPLFSKIKYRRGIVTATFNEALAPFLIALNACFTKYNLLEYLLLPSAYSQRIFEILKSWQKVQGCEVILNISQLHHMLDTPPSFRKNFVEFRRWVLEKAHKDIHEKTSLRYEWESIKVGRSVEKIRFTFGSKKELAAKVKEEAKVEKQKRLNNQRFRRAVECAKAKGGDCRVMDNTRIVCKLCREVGICKFW